MGSSGINAVTWGLQAHVREGARLSASTSELLRIKSRTMANNQDYTEDMAQGDFSNESNYGDFQQTEAQVVQEPAEANGSHGRSHQWRQRTRLRLPRSSGIHPRIQKDGLIS